MAVLDREGLEALEILGHVYFLQGRRKEARIVFSGLLALDEGNQCALGHLAALGLEEGEGEEALARLEDLDFSAEKADPRLWLMRAQALSLLGRGEEAAENLAEYVRRIKG